MRRILSCSIILAGLVCFTSCADMQTIGRTTLLPASTLPASNDGKLEKAEGKAIHLDAQQRLVLVKPGGHYCAEPSPDALAAYASSLGLGVSVPSQGAASVAQALQSSAGSIGLRTQSITLMRDALYRMCEAYENGVIGPIQVSMLLGRSQDLTAVVLAVEQLTGAVAATQVALTGTSGSSASASLLSNQQLLDAARKDEKEKEDSLAAAKKEQGGLENSVKDKETALKAAQENEKVADTPEKKRAAADQVKLKQDDLDQTQAKLKTAKDQVEFKQKLYDESKRTRETIENIKDAAVTNATANTSSTGQFGSSPIQRNVLDSKATESIAMAVEGMVKAVLDKSYAPDSCMTFLTANRATLEKTMTLADIDSVKDVCISLLKATITAETEKITRTEAHFGPDENTALINNAVKKDVALGGKLREWLNKKYPGLMWDDFLYGKGNSNRRAAAIKELKIQ